MPSKERTNSNSIEIFQTNLCNYIIIKMDSTIILNQLRTMGFAPEEVPGFGEIFTFEGMNFLYMPEEGDEEFFRLSMPNLFDVTADNRSYLLDIVNDLNVRMKYSKTVITDDGVWVFYEHRMEEDENLEDLIEHALYLLRATAYTFHRMVNGEGASSEKEEFEIPDEEVFPKESPASKEKTSPKEGVSSRSRSDGRTPWEE